MEFKGAVVQNLRHQTSFSGRRSPEQNAGSEDRSDSQEKTPATSEKHRTSSGQRPQIGAGAVPCSDVGEPPPPPARVRWSEQPRGSRLGARGPLSGAGLFLGPPRAFKSPHRACGELQETHLPALIGDLFIVVLGFSTQQPAVSVFGGVRGGSSTAFSSGKYRRGVTNLTPMSGGGSPFFAGHRGDRKNAVEVASEASPEAPPRD